MRRFLHIDEATRELRLVMVDLGDGRHERTEFRVVDPGGAVLRGMERWGHLDGAPADAVLVGTSYRNYCAPRSNLPPSLAFESDRVYFDVEDRAVGPTEKTPCRRAGRPRRPCFLCRAEEQWRESWSALLRRRAVS